jgi:hypothetical protein
MHFQPIGASGPGLWQNLAFGLISTGGDAAAGPKQPHITGRPKEEKEPAMKRHTEEVLGDPILPSLMMGGMSSSMGLSAISLVAFLDYTSRLRAERRAANEPSLFDQLRHFWGQYRKWRDVKNRLGVALDIPCTEVDDLLAEVQRHRWIEAEKAGRDIWSARNPRDPETSALRDWFSKHYQNWRAAREQQTINA